MSFTDFFWPNFDKVIDKKIKENRTDSIGEVPEWRDEKPSNANLRGLNFRWPFNRSKLTGRVKPTSEGE